MSYGPIESQREAEGCYYNYVVKPATCTLSKRIDEAVQNETLTPEDKNGSMLKKALQVLQKLREELLKSMMEKAEQIFAYSQFPEMASKEKVEASVNFILGKTTEAVDIRKLPLRGEIAEKLRERLNAIKIPEDQNICSLPHSRDDGKIIIKG